ncbi:MAG: metal-dependent hydrolase [Halobacteriota archaeon]
MFVGHAFYAFAFIGMLAYVLGASRRRALVLGVTAGAFAAIPDVDILYALVGPLQAQTSSALGLASAFWSTGNVVHRTATHSLVVAVPAAVAMALWVGDRTEPRRNVAARGLALAILSGLVVAFATLDGVLSAVITVVFGVAALAVADGVRRWTTLSWPLVFGTSLFGFISHPFGDVLTGTPPAFFAPLDVAMLSSRILLSSDPTVHLLATFGVELCSVWLAAAVFLRLSGLAVTPEVAPRATVAAGYAASVLLIPAPTLELSYPFVFSVIGVGLIGFFPRVNVVPTADVSLTVERLDRATAFATGLSAVTLAWAAYTATYVLL